MRSTIQRWVPHAVPKSKPKLEINRIRVSEKERIAAQLSRQNIQSGVEEFHKNGLVILENAVGQNAINHVHQRMVDDFHKYRRSSNIHWNQGRCSGNISQTPPLLPEYLHEEIWANRLGVNLMEYVLGPKPQLSFATSNIALPNSQGRQAVHSDYYCSHFDFPAFLEVNIYLHDVDAHNGATEFWLGTHTGYSKDDHSSPTTGWIKQEVFASRAAVSPPIQPAISKGSLLIRDLRTWHAGKGNATEVPRIVLGFMYSPRWFGSHMRMRLPYRAKKCLESWEHIDCLDNAEFVTEDFNYLEFHQDINLTQTPADPGIPYVSKHGVGIVTPRDYWDPP